MNVDISKVLNVVIVDENYIVDTFLLRGAIFDKATGTLTLKRQLKEKIDPIEIPKDNQDQEREDWKSIEETIFGIPKELPDGK